MWFSDLQMDIYSGYFGPRILSDLFNSYGTPILLPLLGSFVVYLFAQMYSHLPWILWKHLFTDFCLLISLPLYVAIFAGLFSDIWDYCVYEKKNLKWYDIRKMKDIPDVYLEVWSDVKYHSCIKEEDIGYIRCTDGFYSPHPLSLQNPVEAVVTAPGIRRIEAGRE